jgi:cytochrome bd-type quinol oxidase subunit 2
MTAVALVFVPLVIGYQTWIYRVFRQKVDDDTGGILY